MAEEQSAFVDELIDNEQEPEENPEEEHLRKLYLGGLKRTTTKEEVEDHFRPLGDVDNVAVAMDNDEKSKGFGFVTMKTIADTDAVLLGHETSPTVLDGKKIEVRRAIPRNSKIPNDLVKKVFVAGLNKGNITQDDLKEYFGEIGTVKSVSIAIDKNTDQSKGFGFVELEYYFQVDKAALMTSHVIKGCKVDVNKAHADKKKSGSYNQSWGGGGGYGRGGGGGGGGGYGGGGHGYGYGRDWGNGYSNYEYDDYSGGYDGYYSQGSSHFGPQRGGGYGGGRGRGRGRGFRPY